MNIRTHISRLSEIGHPLSANKYTNTNKSGYVQAPVQGENVSQIQIYLYLNKSQPLVKMSTRNIPEGKAGRCVRLTTSPRSRAECHEIWEPRPPGTLRATPGLLRDSFFLIKVNGRIFFLNNHKV